MRIPIKDLVVSFFPALKVRTYGLLGFLALDVPAREKFTARAGISG